MKPQNFFGGLEPGLLMVILSFGEDLDGIQESASYLGLNRPIILLFVIGLFRYFARLSSPRTMIKQNILEAPLY
jgi:hypothetical protein